MRFLEVRLIASSICGSPCFDTLRKTSPVTRSLSRPTASHLSWSRIGSRRSTRRLSRRGVSPIEVDPLRTSHAFSSHRLFLLLLKPPPTSSASNTTTTTSHPPHSPLSSPPAHAADPPAHHRPIADVSFVDRLRSHGWLQSHFSPDCRSPGRWLSRSLGFGMSCCRWP